MQIGNEVFQGTFKKPLGTVLLFGYQDESSSQEAQDIKPSSWGLVGHTEETIQFQKVQLRKREDEANANEAHQTYRGKEEKE